MKRVKPVYWIGVFVVFGLTVSGVSVAASGNLFCCNDEAGKQTCSDILPSICYGKIYREIGPTGRTIRTVKPPPPPPSAEEIAKKQAEDEKKRKEDEIALAQKHKDNALLDTYGSVRDIDAMRERALGDTGKDIKAAEEAIVALKERKAKLKQETAAYKKPEDIPADIRMQLSEIKSNIQVQEEFIADKKKSTASITQKYDEDKRRYIELTNAKK